MQNWYQKIPSFHVDIIKSKTIIKTQKEADMIGKGKLITSTVRDERFGYVTRETAPYVEWLEIQENPYGSGWAAGENYGSKLREILSDLKNWPQKALEVNFRLFCVIDILLDIDVYKKTDKTNGKFCSKIKL